MTRRLVDVAQDIIVTAIDCTDDGMELQSLTEGGEVIQELGDRILGRTALTDILDPYTDEVICSAGEEINERVVEKVDEAGVDVVNVRSPLTCRTKRGVV
ncbi:MAG: hypothetical protein R2827_14225 [Bdellovibrionales bacterium]